MGAARRFWGGVCILTLCVSCKPIVDAQKDQAITLLAIPGIVAPVRGAAPTTQAIDTTQYAGTVAWSPADSVFSDSTVYTAILSLSAKADYTFHGVAANAFTVAGATVTNEANSGTVTAVFPLTGAFILTADYFRSTPGFTIEYAVTVPAGYTLTQAAPTKLWNTFQDVASRVVSLVSSDCAVSRHSACSHFSVNSSGVRYNGGSTSGLSSLPFRKIHLADTLDFSTADILTIEETEEWYGICTYTVTKGLSMGGYLDCLKVSFSSSSIFPMSTQKAHGSYWLARDVGLVRYEAILDESGSLGNSGESFLVVAQAESTAPLKALTGRVTTIASVPIAGAHVSFTVYPNWFGITTDSSGIYSIPAYFLPNQNLPYINIFTNVDAGTNQALSPKRITVSTCGSANIDLGDIMYTYYPGETYTVAPSVVSAKFSDGSDALNNPLNVNASCTYIDIVFDQNMSSGYSVYNLQTSPAWLDVRTLRLTFANPLSPGASCSIGLNSGTHTGFENTSAIALPGTVIPFTVAN